MNLKRFFFIPIFFFISFFLVRDFLFFRSIESPFIGSVSSALSFEARNALSQPYEYLGKGRQSFAFGSKDGLWVVKFFNKNYFSDPFWSFFISGEKEKREKRKKFYKESYLIAEEKFLNETAIAYFHSGPTFEELPFLTVKSPLGIQRRIDLNRVPFVLQKRVEPLYCSLETLGEEAVAVVIDQFAAHIALRIKEGIGDCDHDVEHNYGLLNGRLIHLDPGRLYWESGFDQLEKKNYAWWSATHQLRKWLEKNHPSWVHYLDISIKKHDETSGQE